ncbi:MAG TPA: alkaline phosphatase family protein [Terriglobales bacterium]|nr:alkaline phosphatase family protein [Terriglobales bacterium]
MRTKLLSLSFVAGLLLAGICAGCGNGGIPTARLANAPSRGAAAHVILVVEENQSFSTVYHNQMPWLSALGDEYGIATNYLSNERGSLLDYLWLSSGRGEIAFGCGGNQCQHTITDTNIFRELNKAGMSWNVYADSLPKAGFMGMFAGSYVKRHNPAVWYSDVVDNRQQQQNVLPFSQFAVDLAANDLPDYTIIVPNLKDDAHNGTPQAADRWLKRHIGPLLDSPYFQTSSTNVMFITFDNGKDDAEGRVFTAVIGQNVIPGVKVETLFHHQNTLRTIMELLGLRNYPGESATAEPMNEFFK